MAFMESVTNRIRYALNNGAIFSIDGYVRQNCCDKCKRDDSLLYLKKTYQDGTVHYWMYCYACGNSHAVQSLKNRDKRTNSTLEHLIKRRIKEEGHCYFCGSTTHLHGHHIKPVTLYPQGKYDPKNIMVVCSKCHGEIHGMKFKDE